jgi:hypothetical protein
MADIDVVPKRHTTTWLWVIVALVVAAVLLYLLFPMGADQTRPLSHSSGRRLPRPPAWSRDSTEPGATTRLHFYHLLVAAGRLSAGEHTGEARSGGSSDGPARASRMGHCGESPRRQSVTNPASARSIA